MTEDTIFIRNLSFDTDQDCLKEFIESNFGDTAYCLICKDKDTDESKGTAFAKFKDPDNAAKCLREFKDREMQTKFHLDGRNLMIFAAINRDKMSTINHKEEKNKDKRNLYLSKEGYFHPKSEEAAEMSSTDLEKRRVLNSRKLDLLKNLHNFISDTRLCIHNLPSTVDDQKLRKIFLHSVREKYPDAKITECRVMRNKKGSGALGVSKGFGFVSFSKHEHALFALRNINNNPAIFTNDRRPIVEFSIENMVALNKKKTRLVNSQRKNQALRTQSGQSDSGHSNTKTPKKGKDKKLARKNLKKKSTVTIKNIDTSEEAAAVKNLLDKAKSNTKANKLKKMKRATT